VPDFRAQHVAPRRRTSPGAPFSRNASVGTASFLTVASLLARLAAALLMAVSGVGRAAAADAPSYALGPQAMGPIAQMVERMQPALRNDGVGIEHDRVVVHLCAQSTAGSPCFVLRLDHPSSECGERHWAQFCASFPDGDPPPAALAAIADAVRGFTVPDVWSSTTRAPAWHEQWGVTQVIANSRALLGPAWHEEGGVTQVIAISLALLFVPFGAGWLLGIAVGAWRGRRIGGLTWATAAVSTPAALAFAIDARSGSIGIWDALLVGATVGAGILLGSHRRCANWRGVAVMFASFLVWLPLLELASRLILPPPPAFPSAQGPSLFMSEALRVTRASGLSLAEAGRSTCDAIHGVDRFDEATFPAPLRKTWQPRADARAHILHLGDSMVFGLGQDRFTDFLNRLQPDVEHVNAAIPGTGPDVYLVLERLIIERHHFTAVVMHLTPNDYTDVDAPARYPCTHGQSLLEYGPLGPRLRLADASPAEETPGDLPWLIQNSPPPYVLRACVGSSSFAAHLAAAWVAAALRLGYAPAYVGDDTIRKAHLTAILREARDELKRRHIPLVVDIFRDRSDVETGSNRSDDVDWMKHAAEELGIPTLDTWEPLRAAEQRGVQPFLGATDPHFNRDGHALIADWLNQELPGAIDRAQAAL
jgi:hypothetical protein